MPNTTFIRRVLAITITFWGALVPAVAWAEVCIPPGRFPGCAGQLLTEMVEDVRFCQDLDFSQWLRVRASSSKDPQVDVIINLRGRPPIDDPAISPEELGKQIAKEMTRGVCEFGHHGSRSGEHHFMAAGGVLHYTANLQTAKKLVPYTVLADFVISDCGSH